MRAWILGCFLAAACTSAQGDPAAPAAPAAPAGARASVPIVVELFTSQGCSSCPPADRLLSSLARARSVGDRKVVPLSFHVDYWNDLGWADPFSSPLWSQRQRAYADAMGENGVYTPQLVIAGRAHVVGNDRRRVEKAIAAAPAMTALAATAEWSSRAVAVRVSSAAAAGTEVWVAIWQDGLATKVERGENRGEALRNDHVVRRLMKVAGDGTVTVPLDPSWKNLGGLVFAQQSEHRGIVAAVELAPPAAAAVTAPATARAAR
jgi:hypothetical protein